MSDFPPAVLRALKKRSRGICEGCGLAEATEAHHRQYRSRGGPETLANALHLCGRGNMSGCHGKAHTADGEALGWSIRTGFDPLEVPVRTMDGFSEMWCRLTDELDELVPMNQYDAIEYLTVIGARKAVA